MDMKDKFYINLKKTIGELPQYSPPENLWDKIAGELDFNDKLGETARNLPQVSHNNELWDRIVNKLDQKEKLIRRKKAKIITWSLSIAASAAIILFILIKNSGNKDIIYSEEYQLEESFIELNKTIPDDPVKMLKQLCVYSMDRCTDPVFEREMSRLIKLDEEIKRLQIIIDNYGESPAIVKSLINMENQKAGLVKELLNTLRT